MLTKSISVLLLCCVQLLCFAQESTSYGKFGIGLEGLTNVPLLSGSFSDKNYRLRGGEMKESTEWLNYGASAFFLRKMNRRYSIGLGGNLKQFQVSGTEYFSSITIGTPDFEVKDTTWLRMEPWSYNTYSGLFLMEFYPKNGVGLIGFSHRVGLGFSFTKPGFRSYNYSLNEYGEEAENSWTSPDSYSLDPKDFLSYQSFTAFYSVQIRYPLSRHLAVDLGVNYLLNAYLKPSDSQLFVITSTPLRFSDNFNSVQRENFISMSFKAGMTFLF